MNRPLLTALCLLGLSCEAGLPRIDNPNNCTRNTELCPAQDLVCDPVTQTCIAPSAPCGTSADCPMAASVACQPAGCAPCQNDGECATWSAQRSQQPALDYCVSGVCKQCRGEADCMMPASPICDATSGLCRPCQKDSDCSSGICLRAGDYPETPVVVGVLPGQCVPSSQISYVDLEAPGCSETSGGTQVAPFCSLPTAVTYAPPAMPPRPYILVAPSVIRYDNVVLSTGNRVIVGMGRDAMPPVKLGRVQVDMGATLTVRDATMDLTLANAAAKCRSGASLYLQRLKIGNDLDLAVDASDSCARLFIDSCHITSIAGYGVVTGTVGTTNNSFRIINSAVVGSGNVTANEREGVLLGPRAAGQFLFNTLTGNFDGIRCMNNQVVSDSIVAANKGAQITACTSLRTVTMAVDLAPGPDPRLLDTQANATCCINQGLVPGGLIAPTDYFGLPRTQGSAPDIGYHEFR